MGVLLTKEQEQEILHTSVVFTNEELQHLLCLEPYDLDIIKQNRGAQNQLGFALQLCWIRFTGGTFSGVDEIPEYFLQYMAAQVGIDKNLIAGYGERRPTKAGHFKKIRETYGYRTYDNYVKDNVSNFVNDALEAGRSPQAIVGGVVELMKSNKWLMPSLWTLEVMVKECSDEFHKGIYNSVYSLLTPEQLKAIDNMIKVADGEGQRISPIQRLKDLPGRSTPRAMQVLLEKLKEVQEVGIKVEKLGVHQNKLRKTANSYRNISSARLREYKKEKKYAPDFGNASP